MSFIQLPSAASAIYSSTASTSGTLTTTNGTPASAASVALSDDTVYMFDVTVAGRRTDSAGYFACKINAAYRRTGGGSATLLSTDSFDFSTGSDTGYTVSMGVSGNSMVVFAIGAVGHTINWSIAVVGVQA